MKFISTNGKAQGTSFMGAMRQGLAPDGGLYMPDEIPRLRSSFWDSLPELTFNEIAFEMSRGFLSGELTDSELISVVEDAFNFPVELKHIDGNHFVLELFHGPTLAFKDFGARFMARLFSEQAKSRQEEVTILVATSGDTGSAVANGFYNVEGVNVCVLYPKGKVSPLQEKQMTTLGGNITVLEVGGVFDDCQKLVKKAFRDPELAKKIQLSSANSINIARLLPQSFYYAYAYGVLRKKGYSDVVFSVPSGNFGNLTGGLLAQKMGLPVQRFIAATNSNNIVPEFLKGKEFTPKPSVKTISNAMDVGDPSNFARIKHLFNGSEEVIRNELKGYFYSDSETSETICEIYTRFNYLMCPHTAIGYRAAKEYDTEMVKNAGSITLGTAHPIKFKDVIEPIIKHKIEIPQGIKTVLTREKKSQEIDSTYKSFKAFLKQSF
jgi:threonine synthase